MELACGEFAVDEHVPERIVLSEGLAFKLQVESRPHETMRAFRTDKPRSPCLLETPVRMAQHRRHRRGIMRQYVLRDRHQFHSALNLHACFGDRAAQNALSLYL